MTEGDRLKLAITESGSTMPIPDFEEIRDINHTTGTDPYFDRLVLNPLRHYYIEGTDNGSRILNAEVLISRDSCLKKINDIATYYDNLYGAYCLSAIDALKGHTVFKRDIRCSYSRRLERNIDLMTPENAYSGILHTLYIVPEYRNRGLATYIVRNLSGIVADATLGDVLIRCLITMAVPYRGDEPKSGYAAPGEREDMRQMLIKTLKTGGYAPVGDKKFLEEYGSDLYIKDYLEQYAELPFG